MKARMGSQIIPYIPGPAEMISIKFAPVRYTWKLPVIRGINRIEHKRKENIFR